MKKHPVTSSLLLYVHCKSMWHLIGLIFFSFTLCCLPSCGETPSLTPLSSSSIIVAFGDSLTEGVGADPGEAYPNILAELLSITVINAGISGELSAKGKKRLPSVLEKHQPQLLILCHGGNDLLQKKSPKHLKENLDAMVTIARDRNIDVLLVGVPQPSLSLSIPSLYREIAQEHTLPYEGKILRSVLRDSSLKNDPIHPNGAGYEKLAQALAKLIEKSE